MSETQPNRIRIGQTVYLVASRVRIKEAVVRRVAYGLYTVQFTDTGGGVRLPADRLYPTREEAQRHLRPAPLLPAQDPRFGYWHNVPRWMA